MIKKLRVQNFRKHHDYSIELQPGITVITGPNGSGKTSLIEAIYVALHGKSWRSSLEEVLRDGSNWWRIDVDFTNGEKRVVRYSDNIKTFEIDGKKLTCLPAKLKKPVVLFEPNDLNLLYGSPARRRDFIDNFIAQVEPQHGVNLRKFERVLRQRNNLLKQGAGRGDLFVWDIQFADLAEKIISSRQIWVKEINQDLSAEYSKIASHDEKVEMKYQPPHRTRQQIITELNKEYQNSLPYTSSGPQTHDVIFKIRGHSAKNTASRGENRTIIFAAIKMMINILHKNFNEVYILFDDIDSELDQSRQAGLEDSFAGYNLIATTISPNNKNHHNSIEL